VEDHESINPVPAVSAYLSHIEQHPFVHSVAGLIFGHYSDDVPRDLLDRLARFGERYGVPVAYTDDFGHCGRHAILPVGVRARLDAGRQEVLFL
jgi:muramoyltetrapeptide carboxypeptidase